MQLWDVIVVSLIQGYIGVLNQPRTYNGSSQPPYISYHMHIIIVIIIISIQRLQSQKMDTFVAVMRNKDAVVKYKVTL